MSVDYYDWGSEDFYRRAEYETRFESLRGPTPEGQGKIDPDAPIEPRQLSNYWPDIHKAIKECKLAESRGIPITSLGIKAPICLICNESEISIDHLRPLLVGSFVEGGLLTACGHVLGKRCMETWEKHCRDTREKFTCLAADTT
ncbi:hypothetical protein QBC37DRAFT_374795 [Rhypophila decipiens]|uniref:Uncharacterized protein n=1 Tax=Rhypophila decipiens TaxID=261697 RepID=A0AAN6Y9U1_9PEZI|nr:hypothetical protein QBC37DRAFT_374795 [Rhypophila decipiens]